ncbi:MAG: sodium:solute symporter, partial [Victivallaceae bacterium]
MFRVSDMIAIGLFLGAMAWMGVYFSRKNKSTEDYFLGNRSFPGWAVGLSMLGTSISSVTFLAIPAAAYILDYRQAVTNLALPVAAILAIYIFIPFFRRGNAISAFEYLEERYGMLARSYAALCFVVLQAIRLALILYLVSIPVAAMLDVHIGYVIVIGGVIVGFYTVLGGIEAVIWTDVVQTIILLLGGVLCLGIIIYDLPGGISQVIEIGTKFDKFSPGPISFALDERTFLVVLLLGVVNFTTEYSSNQNVVQRYIAAKSTREARKATLICMFMSVPTWMSFFFLGTCLFAFYHVFPDPQVARLA